MPIQPCAPGKGYEALRDQLHATWGGMSDLDDMPKAIVHTDVHWGNTVRTPAGDMMLIDWDDAGLGPAIQDMGYFIAHKAVLPTEGVRWAPEMSIAFLQGYEQARPLSDAERQALPHSIVYGAPSYVLPPGRIGSSPSTGTASEPFSTNPKQCGEIGLG